MNIKPLSFGLLLSASMYGWGMEFADTKEKFYEEVSRVQARDIDRLKAFSMGGSLGPCMLFYYSPFFSSSGIASLLTAGATGVALFAEREILARYYGSLSCSQEKAFKRMCERCFHGVHGHTIDSNKFQRFMRDKNTWFKSNTRRQFKKTSYMDYKIRERKTTHKIILFANWKHNLCLKQDDDTFDPGCKKVYKELERFYYLCAVGAISFISKDPSDRVYDARCVRPFPGVPSIAKSEIPKLYGTKVGLPVQFCLSKKTSSGTRRRFETLFYDKQLEKQLDQKEKRE